MERFQQQLAPANKFNQIIINDVRISVISSKIVRVEKSEEGFIDNRTAAIYCRNYCKDIANIVIDNDIVTIQIKDRKYIINSSSLKYRVFISKQEVFVNNKQNLKGTKRTLDGNGGTGRLPNGLMSKSGLTIFNDSKSCLLNEDGSIQSRPKGYVDFYILAFGRDYLGGLKEFYNLSGKTPIIPKYALGNWWSRYHAYTDKEYLALMDKFKAKGVPFTVSTIDMDWHMVKNVPKDVPYVPIFGRGWTGYTFEKQYFPNYKEFLKELKNRNLKVAINLHPKEGVRYYEQQYEKMARANGIDPKSKEPVKFDLNNTTFRNSYFDILHHPYEKDGVDIWWIDWQQGRKSSIKGVDPLWTLNHYHYIDANREKNSIILSRFSGIGSHRYPVGFSGDTVVCWNSLKYQPWFTLCSSNVGYTWWSHDIGGHLLGYGNNELYLRWVQLGCFLPINRLHSNDTGMSKEPWLYPKVEKEAIKFLRLRHSLIAFCYSASIINHNEGIPICSPMYYFYDEPNAYKKKYRNQYIFASSLLVCPICEPKLWNKESIKKVWFPKGTWINIFNGKKYEGDNEIKLSCPLDEYLVFARAGSFLPLIKNDTNEIDYTYLKVKVFLGEGKYELFDDNGSLKFNIMKNNKGYKIVVEKVGNIPTNEIEFEFVGQNIKNKKMAFDNSKTIEICID